MTQLRTSTATKCKRQSSEQCSERGHQDRSKAQQTRLINRFLWRLSTFSLRLERKVDHHDGVFLHNADQKNDSNKRDDTKLHVEDEQRQNRAYTGRRQCRKNRYRVDVALIEHSQNDVNGNKSSQHQIRLIGKRTAENCGSTLKARMHAGRYPNLGFGSFDRLGCCSQRSARSKIEGNCRYRELPLMIDRYWSRGSFNAGKGAKRNNL